MGPILPETDEGRESWRLGRSSSAALILVVMLVGYYAVGRSIGLITLVGYHTGSEAPWGFSTARMTIVGLAVPTMSDPVRP